MRSGFETWIAGLTDDDGSGTTGDLLNASFFNSQMGIIDDAINTTGGLITDNTTYYVATTGSDVTGDGSVTTPWATPAYALSQLGNYRVQEGKTLTIQCDDGTYTFTAAITNLPKGFLLKGKNTYTKTMSSVQSSSGSTGSWSIVINLDNVTNITTSDYAIITSPSGGSNPTYIAGVFDITAVDAVNNRITVSSTHRAGAAPSGAVTATVTIIKTIFSYTSVGGISVTNYHGGTLQNLILKGDATAGQFGVLVSNKGVLTLANVGVLQFAYGALIQQGGLLGGGYFSANTTAGVVVRYHAALIAGSAIVSGNAADGVNVYNGAHVNLETAIITGNAQYGVIVSFADGYLPSAKITTNSSYGLVVKQGGHVNAQSTTISGNGTYDVYAEKYGYGYLVSATIAGSVSPTLNTQGNEYGYIDT